MSDQVCEVRNLEETARFFSLSVPTMKSWVERGCPVVKRGGNGVAWEFDLRAVADWVDGWRRQETEDAENRATRDAQLKLELLGGDVLPDPVGSGGVLSSKARAEALKAELDKVKLGQLRRDLVRADEVRDDLAQILATVRDRLLVLPDDLGRRFGLSHDQVEEAEEMMHDLLNDLADSIEQAPSLRRPEWDDGLSDASA